LQAKIPPAVVKAGLPSSSVPDLFKAYKNGTAAALQKVPGFNAAVGAALQTAVKDSYSRSFRIVFLSSLGFAGIALVASVFAQNVDHLMTNFLNKRIDGKYDATRENTVEAQMEERK